MIALFDFNPWPGCITKRLLSKVTKVDLDEITQRYGTREDDPDNLRFLDIWQAFPHPYLYLGGGIENERFYVVVVLAEGLTREELEETPIVALKEPYTNAFTPARGIWIKW